MRWWPVIASIAFTGAAHAEPVGAAMPLASRFDLTSFMTQATIARSGPAASARWLTGDIAPPPGPPRDPPLLRIRGKKVKMRVRF